LTDDAASFTMVAYDVGQPQTKHKFDYCSAAMFLRSLVQGWLQNAAKAKLRDVVAEAARGGLAPPASSPPTPELKPCDLGVLFALGAEAGHFEDRLSGLVTIRGAALTLREGGLNGCRVVVALSGPGRQNAARAAELLIDGHHPRRLISAGFAGALWPALKRNDILIADRVLAVSDTAPLEATAGRDVIRDELPIDVPAELQAMLSQPDVHRGQLLTVDRIVRLPGQRQTLFEGCGALAVDMETFAVAEVCVRRQTPFSSIRVISDTAAETLPPEIDRLLAQRSGAAQWGTALGSIWRRPSTAKDLYRLMENALTASDRLAKFLAGVRFA
jgi:adenosylhomocysteine nucleosidase